MIKAQLMMALDFAADKKNPVAHGKASRLCDDTWYLYSFGPTYSNTYKVSEFDDAGLELLKKHEEKSPG